MYLAAEHPTDDSVGMSVVYEATKTLILKTISCIMHDGYCSLLLSALPSLSPCLSLSLSAKGVLLGLKKTLNTPYLEG